MSSALKRKVKLRWIQSAKSTERAERRGLSLSVRVLLLAKDAQVFNCSSNFVNKKMKVKRRKT